MGGGTVRTGTASKRIKVVHCIGTLDVGGAERQITELLDDTDRAEVMGQAGRERVEGNFGIDRMVAEFAVWYSELAPFQLGSDPN